MFTTNDFTAAGGAGDYAQSAANGGQRFADFVAAVKTLVEMMRAYRAGEFPMKLSEVAALVAALLYVVNPVDAIPEAVLGPLGLPDDVAAVAVAVGALTATIMRYRKQFPAGS